MSVSMLIEEYKHVYDNYVQIGNSLKEDPMILDIKEKLRSINTNKYSNAVPFLFIENSSGTGKTQSAFGLKSALNDLKQENRFFYLLCSPVTDNSQLIYRVFRNQSHAFQECIRKDEVELNGEFSCLGLSQSCLYVFGFFRQMIENPLIEHIKFEKCVAKDVWNALNQAFAVVVLDEFPSTDVKCLNHLRLLRNSIRALKFGLVVMGTNSTAANLVDSNLQSRDTTSFLWCFLYPRLPKVKIDHIQVPQSPNDWIREVIISSRPLFSSIASEILIKEDTWDYNRMTLENIDDWFTKIAFRISDEKKLFDHDFGLHGQVCLFLNMSYPGSQCSSLIHRHFAHLFIEPSQNSLCIELLNDMRTKDSSLMWEQKTVFPELADDVLLYLCLMGTKKFSPFFSKKKQTHISFREAASYINTHRRNKEFCLNFDNAVQVSNDGMFLEALLASALCVASRANGVGGICLRDYICALFSHIQLSERLQLYNLKTEGLNDLLRELLNNFVIPVLAPPNQEWPKLVSCIPNSKFGYLARAKNKDRIDVTTNFNLSGESKDHKKTISAKIMRDILNRVPVNTKVHIIFASSLQGEYFSENKTKQCPPDWTSLNLCCFVVRLKSDNNLQLDGIRGLPGFDSFNGNSRLVLFFLV